MEDYEYLKLLERKLPKLAAKKKERAMELLKLGTMVSTPYDYTRDPAEFADLRQQVADILDQ
jgi:hypothetical protein